MTLPPTFPIRLLSVRTLSPSVREMLFQREDGPLDFEAGQWLSLQLPVESTSVLRRSYSIASAPNGTDKFEMAITLVQGGPGSALLHRLEPGDMLQATGPQGFFTREENTPSLFVATGTGITPLRSMIHAALRAGATDPMALLLGVRHEEDILYREEMTALQREHPNFSFHITLSRPHEHWTGHRGYVQEHVQKILTSLGKQPAPHIYICGMDRMVKAVRDLLRKQLDVPRARVHSERFD